MDKVEVKEGPRDVMLWSYALVAVAYRRLWHLQTRKMLSMLFMCSTEPSGCRECKREWEAFVKHPGVLNRSKGRPPPKELEDRSRNRTKRRRVTRRHCRPPSHQIERPQQSLSVLIDGGMNGYLLTKCRSEQQLLNELAKLVAAARGSSGLSGGDAASKKTMELLRELAVVYVSPAPPLAVPHSVVKDLSSLLALLKDKKDDLRAARLVQCLLARLIEQFERRYAVHMANASLQRTQSFELCVSVMASLLKALEAAELSHSSLPRQCVALRMFALLCRAFGNKHDVLLARTRAVLLQSPAYVLLLPLASGAKTLSAADKKQITSATGKKDFPAQIASLGAATHAIRFHVPTPSVVTDTTGNKSGAVVEGLVQAAFLPNCAASRHAAATLLSIFSSNLPDQQGAKTVLRAFEAFVFKFRAASLRVVGDPLSTIYLFRLYGQISRLEVATETSTGGDGGRAGSFAGTTSISGASELLDFSFESSSPKHSPPPPPSPKTKPLKGVSVSRELADRLRDWILDIVVDVANASTPLSSAARAVVMTAIEEAVTEASLTSSGGRNGVFDVVATTLLKMLRDPATASNAPLLHRLCRVTQFAAESLDRAMMKQQQQPYEATASPLQRVADSIADLVTHGNAFVACEALRAQIWLLPRQQAASEMDNEWNALVSRLVALPVDRILPESRRALADALYHRAISSAAGANAVDVTMLAHCLSVTLRWFQSLPCEWHAATLVAVWQTTLLGQPQQQQEPQSATDAHRRHVLESIVAVLDAQHAQRELQSIMHLVQQSALVFLCRDGVCTRLLSSAPTAAETARSTLFLTLSKHMLLAPFVSRRLAVQALAQLHRELQRTGVGQALSGQIAALFQHLTQDPFVLGNDSGGDGDNCVVKSSIHSQRAQQTLGVRDVLLAELQRPSGHNDPVASAPGAPFAVAPLAPASTLHAARAVSATLSQAFAAHPVSTGLDGLF